MILRAGLIVQLLTDEIVALELPTAGASPGRSEQHPGQWYCRVCSEWSPRAGEAVLIDTADLEAGTQLGY